LGLGDREPVPEASPLHPAKGAQLEKTYLNLERKRGGPVEDEEVAKELGLPKPRA
jgi:uncharacterized membrane protein